MNLETFKQARDALIAVKAQMEEIPGSADPIELRKVRLAVDEMMGAYLELSNMSGSYASIYVVLRGAR